MFNYSVILYLSLFVGIITGNDYAITHDSDTKWLEFLTYTYQFQTTWWILILIERYNNKNKVKYND